MDKSIIKKADKLVKEILDHFDLEYEADVTDQEIENRDGDKRDVVKIHIKGEDLGVLIGFRGKNLQAIQYILNLMFNRKLYRENEENDYVKIILDVAEYRNKREESLEDLAKRVRQEVLDSEEEVNLPSMTSFERRIIHKTLSEFDDVATESFGETPERYVKVMPVIKD